MATSQIDDTQLQALAAEGLSPTEIAKRLGIPRSTVRDRLKKLDTASTSEVTPEVSTQGIPHVYNDMLVTMMGDLQELVTWWQERKATLIQASDATQETERITFHVERRWIEAIRRQADLDGLTITQAVNEAFRQHFERK
jgi:transposase